MYSLAPLTLIECTPAELVYIAARAGYDAVSPRLIKMNIRDEFSHSPLTKEQIQATKTAINTTGIKVIDIELARITEDCNPKDFEKSFELGAELGAKHMIMSAWTSRRDDRNFLIDIYSETCDLAKNFNLTIDLEFPSFSRLRTLDEALDIVRASKKENCGILIDTLYLHLSRVNISEIGHVPPEWIHFLHISDCLPGIADTKEGMIQLARDARLYPGEGWIDFQSIIDHCPPVHYSIELPNINRVKELGLEEHARRCLNHTKNIIHQDQKNKLPKEDYTNNFLTRGNA